MTALTRDRNTPRAAGDIDEHDTKGGVRIYAGSIVCLDATGHAVPGAAAADLTAAGRAEAHIDNRDGADADLRVPTRRGIFRFANDGADPVDRTHIGADCYVVDDQTVSAADGGGTRSVAGPVVNIDALGVWVRLGVV
ncbi:hypothetical protein HW532_19105 [Kaustia mangrovi]|uniref:Bacteriophage protein n=1 Tax=Kaustia mangrovi TaxID=2593653 RepID=A0A7S8HDG8_9HYPH|nr:hypothetical protein [Kaustia mangrovi]QPC44625.1 hypothetical protein HW532_19105 [Kaustia mangrovi]